MRIVAYVLAIIVFLTGVLYLTVASDEYNEYLQKANATIDGQNSESHDQESEEGEESGMFGPQHEAVFFGMIGVIYIPVGLWMLRKKEQTRSPYVIVLTGSVALIVFYIITRTVELPLIGLQTDVGMQDTLAKILQVAIVALSGYILYVITKQQKIKNPV